MKFKSIITFSILLALSFSITHEFTFTLFDENKCSVSEFVSEFDAPTGVDDLCDIHCEYHQAYMSSILNTSMFQIYKVSDLQINQESYEQKITQDLIIPPSV